MKAQSSPVNSFMRFLAALWAAIVLFFNTLFTTTPVSAEAEDFRLRRATGQPLAGTGLRNLFSSHRLGGRGSGGSGSGGGGHPSYRAGGRPGSNIHVLPKPCTTG